MRTPASWTLTLLHICALKSLFFLHPIQFTNSELGFKLVYKPVGTYEKLRYIPRTFDVLLLTPRSLRCLIYVTHQFIESLLTISTGKENT